MAKSGWSRKAIIFMGLSGLQASMSGEICYKISVVHALVIAASPFGSARSKT
jgi:hypothetical protein